MSSRVICSVYFERCLTTRDYSTSRNGRGYRTHYVIEAAPQDGYSLLLVTDAEQSQYVGDGRYISAPVYADLVPGGIADDLVHEWSAAGLCPEAGGPGIAVIEGDTPADQELKRLRARQGNWCQAIIDRAEADWIAGRRHMVGDPQRKAAQWMGQLGFKWVSADSAMVKLVPCPMCATKIDSTAIICPNCGNVVDIQRMKRRMDELAAAGLNAAQTVNVPAVG